MDYESDQIRKELQAAKARGEVDEEYFVMGLADVGREGTDWEKEALVTCGMLEDPRIAPLCRALAGSHNSDFTNKNPTLVLD